MNKITEFFLGNRTPAQSDKLANQFSLTCRTLVGGYVCYLGYGLKDAISNAQTNNMRIIFILAVLLFCVAGAFLVYTSVRDFIIGRYVGGKLDLGETPEESESEE